LRAATLPLEVPELVVPLAALEQATERVVSPVEEVEPVHFCSLVSALEYQRESVQVQAKTRVE